MSILEMLSALVDSGDATVYQSHGIYHVTIEDFEGFDDSWDEIMRDFTAPELVDDFLEALEEQALSTEGDFYVTYFFDGYAIRLGYASYDI